MTDPAIRKRRVRSEARRLVRRLGLEQPHHVDIERIAAVLGACVVGGRLDRADAQLARTEHRARIVVADRITDPAERRMAIAHELGHLVLRHENVSAHELCDGAAEDRGDEEEADLFAVELMMPERIVRPLCEVSPVDLYIPLGIAQAFQVPRDHALARFIELTSERCAIVTARESRIVSALRSSLFRRPIAVGAELHRASVAWDHFHRRRLDDEPQEVPRDAWLAGRSKSEIVEHSIVVDGGEQTLSLLWIPERLLEASRERRGRDREPDCTELVRGSPC